MQGAKQLVDESDEEHEKLVGVRSIRKAVKQTVRHNRSDVSSTLERSLFIYLFSVLDSYIGDLIVALFERKPELYRSINREICLSEALQYSSLNELRHVVLEKEVESIRRKSYIDQFKEMEKIFSITLTKFEQWPAFVENTQRRNLFTHCDGVISEQYIKVCDSVGYKIKSDCKIGEKLKIGSKYFFSACQRITEVAVMLGQTLWRKMIPEELEAADHQLHSIIFDFLEMEQWSKAIELSKFCTNLPKVSSDQIDRINAINYAIALRAVGNKDAAKKILNKKDWSATIYDFRMAYAILTDSYSEAAEIMRRIGKKGELIFEIAYHDWPLFREFRETSEFLLAYEDVYGYKYLDKLSSLAKTAETTIEKCKEISC